MNHQRANAQTPALKELTEEQMAQVTGGANPNGPNQNNNPQNPGQKGQNRGG
jgi:bacteriocin-like protein